MGKKNPDQLYPVIALHRGHTLSDGYRANLGLRSAIRVMVLLAEGQLDTDVLRGRRGGQAVGGLTLIPINQRVKAN